ncbi:transforming growth factor-beta-induced protein ig-h3-like [Petromyzon marinus]|uniref:Transforming growth factor-beta-induced protein ig-h3-like n=1 Tax=Petromyzon marinus TaxID=7757 RepID=A0AAJ7UAU3_PETMA|nr:transforming growth factor-beta-induced protein ig-h3-like [Petromyzon marinus]XP_032832900.1 transforming growth factor-beta-induced protein ig-h3-like [Petromyzon marinus]
MITMVWVAGWLALLMAHHAVDANSYFNRLLLHSRIRGRSEGPNMCAVQEMEGTEKRYFSSCKTWYRKKICNVPTMVKFECCPGYMKVEGERGCPAIAPLTNIFSTLEALEANTTRDYITRAGLREELETPKAVTMFAPSDAAWAQLDDATRNALTGSKLKDALRHHMVDRRLLLSDMRQGATLRSQNAGGTINVQHYVNGIVTVNCARVLRPNYLATNGVVHLVDRVIAPLTRSVRDILETTESLGTLKAAATAADLMEELERKGSFTLLAPTNEAFERLPKDVLTRILGDPEALKAVINNHILDSVQCSEAVLGNSVVDSREGSLTTLGCEGGEFRINGLSSVAQRDLAATNGVVHTIGDVLIPDSAKTVMELADSAGVTNFVDMFAEAGLMKSLKPGADYTLLAPTNEATDGHAMSSLPMELPELLLNHIIKGQVSPFQLYNGQVLETLGGRKVRVFVYRTAICVENSCIASVGKDGRNGLVHVMSKILMVPDKSTWQTLQEDADLSILVELIKRADMGDLFSKPGEYTIFAPTNKAFAAVPQRHLDRMKASPTEAEAFVDAHVLDKVLVSGGVVRGVNNQQTSLLGLKLDINQKNGEVFVDGQKILDADKMTTNGVVHKLDVLLPSGAAVLSGSEPLPAAWKPTPPRPGKHKKPAPPKLEAKEDGSAVIETEGDITEAIIDQIIRGGFRRLTIRRIVTNADGSTSIDVYPLEGDDLDAKLRRIMLEGWEIIATVVKKEVPRFPSQVVTEGDRLVISADSELPSDILSTIRSSGITKITVRKLVINPDGTQSTQVFNLEGGNLEEQIRRLMEDGWEMFLRIVKVKPRIVTIRVITVGDRMIIEGDGYITDDILKEVNTGDYRTVTVRKTVTNADGSAEVQTFTLDGDDIEEQLRRLMEQGWDAFTRVVRLGTTRMRPTGDAVVIEGDGDITDDLLKLILNGGYTTVTILQTVIGPDGSVDTRTFVLEGDDIENQLQRIIIDGWNVLTEKKASGTFSLDGDGISEELLRQIRAGAFSKVTLRKTIVDADGSRSVKTFNLEGDDLEGQIRRLVSEGGILHTSVRKTVTQPDGTTSVETFNVDGKDFDVEEQIRRITASETIGSRKKPPAARKPPKAKKPKKNNKRNVDTRKPVTKVVKAKPRRQP